MRYSIFCLDDAERFWKWDRYNLSDHYCLNSSVIKRIEKQIEDVHLVRVLTHSLLINSWWPLTYYHCIRHNSDPTLLFLNSFMCFIILSVTQSLEIIKTRRWNSKSSVLMWKCRLDILFVPPVDYLLAYIYHPLHAPRFTLNPYVGSLTTLACETVTVVVYV